MAGPWRIYASLLRACAFAAGLDCLEDHGAVSESRSVIRQGPDSRAEVRPQLKRYLATNGVPPGVSCGASKRAEATFHNGDDFRVYRPREGDADAEMAWRQMRREIPVWMLSPECAAVTITEQAYLSSESLLSLASLLSTRLHPAEQIRDNLPRNSC